MEVEENMIEFPLQYKPYTLELTNKKNQAVELHMIERFSSNVLKRLQDNHYDYRKIVLTKLEDSKIEMDLYAAKAKEGKKDQVINKQDQSPKPKGKGNQDQSQKANEEESKVSKLKEQDLMKDEDVLLQDSFFADVHSVYLEHNYANLKVVRDKKPIYQSEEIRDSSPRNAGEGPNLG